MYKSIKIYHNWFLSVDQVELQIRFCFDFSRRRGQEKGCTCGHTGSLDIKYQSSLTIDTIIIDTLLIFLKKCCNALSVISSTDSTGSEEDIFSISGRALRH